MDPEKYSELTQILQTLISDKIDEHKTLDRPFKTTGVSRKMRIAHKLKSGEFSTR